MKDNPLRKSCSCNVLTVVLFQVQHELVHIQGAFLRFIPFKWLAFKAGVACKFNTFIHHRDT